MFSIGTRILYEVDSSGSVLSDGALLNTMYADYGLGVSKLSGDLTICTRVNCVSEALRIRIRHPETQCL